MRVTWPFRRQWAIGLRRFSAVGLAWFWSACAVATPGDLDTSFASRGWVELSLPGHDVRTVSIVVDPAGGVVALANAQTLPVNGSIPTSSVLVARWRADGTPDVAFGTAGVTTINVPGFSFVTGNALLRLPGGGYLIGGSATSSADARTSLIRVLPDGTPDAGFGAGGIVLHDFSAGPYYEGIVALVEHGTGYAAMVHRTGLISLAFTRFLASGAIDPAFGTSGVTTVTPAPVFNVAIDLVALADGRLVGVSWAEPTTLTRYAGFVRLLANGVPDASFGPGGVQLQFLDRTVAALTVVPGGVVVSGATLEGIASAAFVGKLLDDGTPDTAFNSPAIAGNYPAVRDVAFSNGRLYGAGETMASGWLPLMIRMQGNGLLDLTFGDEGLARLAAIGNGSAKTLSAEVGGKVFVAGELHPPGGLPIRGFVARVVTQFPDVPTADVPVGGPLAWLILTLSLAAAIALHKSAARASRR